jgi:hypothetical protein
MKAAIVLCSSIGLCLSIGICAAADTKPAAAAAAAGKTSAKPTEIPAGAVELAPSSYRFTDANGVRWLLRKTPFGVAAVEEKSAGIVKATDKGDSVRFVQNSPFGSHSWERKKSELNESEREVWERQRDLDAAK